MSKYKISIIIPVYNAEKTLERCIQKIKEQTYSNWELILVNDGSTDRSLSICQKAQQTDNRIVIVNKPNGGASSARNLGIKIVSGEWISFCDSDDYVGSHWLQNFVDMIELNSDKQYLLVQKINIYKQGIFDSIYYENQQGVINKSQFLSGHFGFVWNKIFRKEIIVNQQIEFDSHIKLFEDELFVLNYLDFIDAIYICNYKPQYYYEWPIYTDKYQESINDVSTQLQIYQLSKIALNSQPNGYHVLIHKFLNRLISKTLLTIAQKGAICDSTLKTIMQITHNDMKYLLRKKLFVLKILSFTNNKYIWKTLFYLHAKLIKLHLLKL